MVTPEFAVSRDAEQHDREAQPAPLDALIDNLLEFNVVLAGMIEDTFEAELARGLDNEVAGGSPFELRAPPVAIREVIRSAAAELPMLYSESELRRAEAVVDALVDAMFRSLFRLDPEASDS